MVGAHPAIQMFSLCSSMKWTHLPAPGGIYDQDPDLLDKFQIIFREISAHERAEAEKEKAAQEKLKKQTTASARGSSGSRRAPRRRR